MELKTKYQYTYFIYPFVVKENKYQKYILKILRNERFTVKEFEKQKDIKMQFMMWFSGISWWAGGLCTCSQWIWRRKCLASGSHFPSYVGQWPRYARVQALPVYSLHQVEIPRIRERGF